MEIRKTLYLLCLLLPLQLWSQEKKPNIIFILADDLGYGNLQTYNQKSPIPTPNIDQLATEGMKFTRFYSGNTVCAPSRCALMTGKHMGTAYIRGNAKATEGLGALRAQDTTIIQRVKANGYITGMFGKWGLGDKTTSGAPHLKGFDNFYGYLDQSHAHDYYTDSLYEIRQGITQVVPVSNKDYTQDLILDKALSFIKENKNKPFFLYLPFTLPHAELIVPDSLLRNYLNADGTSKFAPETAFEKKGNYDSQAFPHAAFAAMITKLDQDVGKITKLIADLNLEEDTYIFFSSDNGPHIEGGADPEYFNSWGPLRGIKRDLYEGGIRVPLLVKAKGKIKPSSLEQHPFAFWDVQSTILQITGQPKSFSDDGISFLPTLLDKGKQKQHDYLFWQFCESGVLKQAISDQNWKLIRLKEIGKPEHLALYNIKNDIGETKDLSSTNAKLVIKLKTEIKKQIKIPENQLFNWDKFE